MVVIALLVTVSGGYVFSTLNKTIETPNTPSPTNTPTISPTQQSNSNPSPTAKPLQHKYTVFEWYLKSDYINNITWLSSVIIYNSSISWTGNYKGFIERTGAFPAQARDSLAAMYLVVPVNGQVEFNSQTGFTKVTCDYLANDMPYIYTLETVYSYLNGTAFLNWKNYVI